MPAVERARRLRESLERPPVAVPEGHCRTCSLAPVCLPEEERFVRGEKNDAKRLFPPDDDRRIIHIVEQGASVRKDGDQIVVYLPDGAKKALPGLAISSLVLHGNVQVSTQMIHFCAAHNIGLHWLSYGGNYVGGLSSGAGPVQRRNRQFQAFQDSIFRVNLALKLVQTKIENQLRYLLRATRSEGKDQRSEETDKCLAAIRIELQTLNQITPAMPERTINGQSDSSLSEMLDKIRGHEGMAGKLYFSMLPIIISAQKGDLMHFAGRNRRPPKDPFNALLSFGYALLYRDCIASLMATGLDPCLGFLHTPRSAAYPLALDLMELFGVILWDIPMIGSVNRGQWTRNDFEITAQQVWLNVAGRRKAIQIYENRKNEKWKHPVLSYSLSYARSIELEAKLLEKEWTGQPGCFAKLRLR